MKKLLLFVVALFAVFTIGNTEVKAAEGDPVYKIAMITDVGTIDDGSFNQGTWEGIEKFVDENDNYSDADIKYYKPEEKSDDAYLDAIALAVAGGAEVIVTPGFLFEVAVYNAQTLYPEVNFVLIDGTPHTADYATFETKENTVSILFNEHESGFLAGYGAVYEGYRNLGFTGGMAVPAVVKFGIGYVAGAYYAAEELGVELNFGNDTYTYFGEFGPKDEFKNLAAGWYNTGTEVIFSAAGGAGSSVMAAAEEEDAMMIGVDIDQAKDSSSVLTSAMKQLGNAVVQTLTDWDNDKFPGGETIYKGADNDGVALPMITSRFENFSHDKYNDIFAKLAEKKIVVPSDYAGLEEFLGDAEGYPEQWVIEGTEQPDTGCFGGIGNGSVLVIVAGIAALGGAALFISKRR